MIDSALTSWCNRQKPTFRLTSLKLSYLFVFDNLQTRKKISSSTVFTRQPFGKALKGHNVTAVGCHYHFRRSTCTVTSHRQHSEHPPPPYQTPDTGLPISHPHYRNTNHYKIKSPRLKRRKMEWGRRGRKERMNKNTNLRWRKGEDWTGEEKDK